MSGWGTGVGEAVGNAIEQALTDAGQITGSPWVTPRRPLPLDEVDWSTAVPLEAVASPSETQWPPTPVQPRVERLHLYHDLWRGDLSRVMDVRRLAVAEIAAINIFRRVTKFVADLLVREVPTSTLEGVDLMTMVHMLVSDMIRHGGGLLLVAQGPEGPLIRPLDAQYAVPTAEGGWIVAEPRMSPTAQSTLPDVLQFIVVQDGEAGVMQRSQTPTGVQAHTNLGPVLHTGPLGTDAEVHVLPALPMQPGSTWGTSWYEDLLTIAVQTAHRSAAIGKILDEHTNPLLLARGDINRFSTVPGVAPSLALGGADQAADASETIKRMRQAGALVAPDGIEDMEYITWDGNLGAANEALDRIDRHFRLISGMPAVLDSDSAVPSGMSLRRMFWQFDAAIAPLYHLIHRALTSTVERFGGTLEWENTFEAVEMDPTMTQREDVEDEDESERGTGQENE